MQSGLGAIVLLCAGWCLSHLSGWALDVRTPADTVQICARHRAMATPEICLHQWHLVARQAHRMLGPPPTNRAAPSPGPVL